MSHDSDIRSIIHQEIARALTQLHPHRIGLVSSYDPNTHSSKMQRQPEGVETGFMPHHALHIGNGWGVLVGAQVGDQYVIGHVLGDVDVPFVAGRLFSDQEKPPTVQAGEILLQHQKGHKFFFAQDGSVTWLHAAANGSIAWDPNGNLTLDSKSKTTTHKGQTINFTAGTSGSLS